MEKTLMSVCACVFVYMCAREKILATTREGGLP